MTGARLTLSIALSDNVRTRPILEGRVRPEAIDLHATRLHPSEMFWRQLRYAEFDVSEMSLSSLMIATARGDRRWVGLPVYTMRKFFHTGIMVRADSGIETPADLRGRRVGVPEYQQTAAIWSRGVLEDEFGVGPAEIEWFMERGPDRSHGGATGFRPPPGVRLNQIPPSTNIGEMLLGGVLDATLLYLNDRNLVDRSRADLSAATQVRTLFQDPAAEGRRYYGKTGIYPINHAMVIRRETYERHPWIATNLYAAFLAAKAEARAVADEVLQPYRELGLLGAEAEEGLAGDPLAYGFKAARPVLEKVAAYVHRQGLLPDPLDPADLFAPNTLEL